MANCLTRENCHAILQKYYQNEYDTNFSYYIKPSERHNILKMRFNPEFSNKRPQFFVKTHDSNSVPLPLVAKNNDNATKEVCFYKYMDHICEKMQPLKNVIPNIYFADKNTSTLVLEDLAKFGYKKYITRQFDEDHVKVALASLAKFHAISIIYDLKFKVDFDNDKRKSAMKECFFGNITDDMLQQLMSNLAQEVQSSKANYQTELFIEYKKMIDDFTTDKSEEKNVCCHGDLFFDNILFQYDINEVPTICKFIDFAFARYKPPAHDVTMLLYTCVNSKLLQMKNNSFLKYYYMSLKSILQNENLKIEAVLPVIEYELSCKKYMRYARMIVALHKIIHNSCQEPKDRCKNYTRKYTIHSDLSTAIDNTILTIEDIHTVVNNKIKSHDYDLQEYELQPVSVKTGFLGEHMNLTVTIHQPRGVIQRLKYFVKALPELESQRSFVIESGATFKETSWFQRLLPDCLANGINIMEECTANCFLARDNDVFVFEDLKEAAYEMIRVRTSIDLDSMKQAIASLAKYHAAPLILEELKSKNLGRTFRLIEHYAKEFDETFYSKGEHSIDIIKAITKSTPTYIDLVPMPNESTVTREDVIDMERQFVMEFYSDVQPSREFRNSICHGDLWTANIMFRKENDIVVHAKFVDFQSYRYGPPAQDLLAMIYLTSDRALRKNHMSYFTTHYYEELSKNVAAYNLNIKDIISSDQFQKSLEHYEKFAVVQATTHRQIVSMSEETLQKLFDDKEWCKKCLFIDRTDTIIQCCNEDPVYRRIQEETLADLRELCEKMKAKFQSTY